jgi:hypothetical protein
VKLTDQDKRETWCTWHGDMAVNKRQAMTLAADANATKNKLLREALLLHVGRVPTDKVLNWRLSERKEPGTPFVWVCWDEKAIAVRTECTSRVKDRRYYLTWYWKTLPSA